MRGGSNAIKYRKLPDISWLFFALIVFMLSSVIGFRAVPLSWAAETTMEVYQQKDGKIFGIESSLDIFDNPKFGGEKLIAPFSKGSYEFAVYNSTNSSPLPYTLDIEAKNPGNVPIAISLEKNGTYVFGGADISEMQYLTVLNMPETLLSGKMTDLYTVHWEWKTESDEIDTAIGQDGTQLYTLIITANGTIEESGGGVKLDVAEPTDPSEPEELVDLEEQKNPEESEEQSEQGGHAGPDEAEHEPAVPVEPDEGSDPERDHNLAGVGTGYDSYLNVFVVIMVLSIIVLIILALFKRGKNDDDSKKDPENM